MSAALPERAQQSCTCNAQHGSHCSVTAQGYHTLDRSIFLLLVLISAVQQQKSDSSDILVRMQCLIKLNPAEPWELILCISAWQDLRQVFASLSFAGEKQPLHLAYSSDNCYPVWCYVTVLCILWLVFDTDTLCRASKKQGGSTQNRGGSLPKMLGVKLFGGQTCQPGSIIVRQRGTQFKAGPFVGMVSGFSTPHCCPYHFEGWTELETCTDTVILIIMKAVLISILMQRITGWLIWMHAFWYRWWKWTWMNRYWMQGRDHTLYAMKSGRVVFEGAKKLRVISVQ